MLTELRRLPPRPAAVLSAHNLVSAAALLLLAGALAWLPTWWALLAPAALAAGVVLLCRPWLGWAAVGAFLPFAAALRFGPATGAELLLLAVAGLWFLDGARRKSLRLTGSAPLVASFVFVALLLITSLHARDFGQALVEVIKWAEFALVLALLPAMVRASGAAAAEASPTVVRSRVHWVTAAIVAGATAQALLGLYQFYFRVGPEWFMLPGGAMRAAGTYGQPNPFAGSLGLVFPVAASLALHAWGNVWQRSPHGNARLFRALAWSGAATLLAAGIFASWSRGGWLAAGAALAAVIVLRSRRAALAAGVAVLLLLAGLLLGAVSPAAVQAFVPEAARSRVAGIPAFFGYGNPLQQEVTDENFAVIERVAHWAAAWRMFEQEPWLGVGAGSYAAAYPDFAEARWGEALGHAHNAWLNTLAELGLAGAAAATLLWGTLIVRLRSALREAARAAVPISANAPAERSAPAADRALIVGALGVLVFLGVHSLVDLLFVQGMVVTLALWPALVIALPLRAPLCASSV